MTVESPGMRDPHAMKRPLRVRLSVRARLLLGMGAMLLPLIVAAVIVLWSLQGVTDAIDEVVEEATEELATVLRLQVLIQDVMIVAHDSATQGRDDPGVRERLLGANQKVRQAFDSLGAAPFKLQQERVLVRSAHAEWRRGHEMSEARLSGPRPANAPIRAQELEPAHAHLQRAVSLLGEVHALAQQEMNGQLARAFAVRQRALVGIASVFAVALGIAIAVGTALTRSILTPIRALDAGVHRFGAGDLSHRVPLHGEDELAALGKTFNAMADALAHSQAALRALSTRDGLTGLVNYREFHRHVTEEVARYKRYGRPFSLLMLDVDHFKRINDTHGHLVGDEALRAVATLIQASVRPTDLVARYGGEEFVVVLPETTGAGAWALADRLRGRIANEALSVPTGHSLPLTVSIGVAAFPEDADTLAQLLSAADRALYAAKAGGRNRAARWSAA